MPWDDNLTDSHLTIAAYPYTPLRVVAGPGTGKTFALMRRIARILESGTAPSDVLTVTFTRTAATELVNKLAALQTPGAATVQAKTLHAYCFSLLRQAAVFAVTNRHARPLLAHELQMLVADLADQFGGRRETKRLILAFEAYWATLQHQQPGWPGDPAEQAFDLTLRAWLHFHEAMLLGELVPLALEFVRNNPHSSQAPAFQHVLVDEYQDLNRADQVLIDELAKNGSVTVVGDPDQSIYRFRFANPEAMLDYPNHHPNTHDEQLVECRRCPQTVVAIAGVLIAHNPRPNPLVLHPRPQNPTGSVQVVQHDSVGSEVESIAAFIDWYLLQHPETPAGEILILATRRQIGYAIRDALIGRSEQYGRPWTAQSFFYEECLDDLSAQEGYTLLALLVSPDDRVALRTWLGLGSTNCRSNGYARLRAYCDASGLSPRAALQALGAGTVQVPYTSALLTRYQDLHARLGSLSQLTGQALVDALFPPGVSECADVRNIANAVVGQTPNPAALLEELRTVVTQPEIPGSQGQVVRVMSLHKSKGLTARVVIVAGCVAGALPTVDWSAPQDERQRQIQEQRRLFYVAITRTTETLVLSSAVHVPFAEAMRMRLQAGPGGGGQATLIASPFLAELGPQRPATETGVQWRQRVGF